MASLKISILLLLCVFFILGRKSSFREWQPTQMLQVESRRAASGNKKVSKDKAVGSKRQNTDDDDDDDDEDTDTVASAGKEVSNGSSRRGGRKNKGGKELSTGRKIKLPGKQKKGKKQGGHHHGHVGGKNKPLKSKKAGKVLSLGSSIDKFSISLYKKMAEVNPNNFVFSPYSVYSALSMLLLGASGRTKTELESGLSIKSAVHPAIKIYNDSLDLDDDDDDDTVLAVANNLYYKPGLKLNPRFLQKLQKFYGATAEQFQAISPEIAINDWIKNKTNGKITNFLSPGAISPSVYAMLINAVYFKGNWNSKFDRQSTTSLPFYVNPSESVNIDTMTQYDQFRVFDSSRLAATILELPYEGDKFAFFVILPKGELNDVELILNAELLSSEISNCIQSTGRTVRVQLPKFKLDTKESMKEMLQSIGITEVFDPSKASFKKLTKDKNVAVSEVFHQAVIELDEEGTEAAAVTSILMTMSSRQPEVIVDRPFMFVLRDKVYGINLFIGRYSNPGAEN